LWYGGDMSSEHYYFGNDKLAVTAVELSYTVGDFNDEMQLIGIEIIGLRPVVTPEKIRAFLQSIEKSFVHCSYDEEADALYLKITDECSCSQVSFDGRIMLAFDGDIVAITADWPQQEDEL